MRSWTSSRRGLGPATELLVLLVLAAGTACRSGTWLRHETEHAVLYYRAGSYAEANLEEAVRLYDESCEWVAANVPSTKQRGKPSIYLHDRGDRGGWVNRVLRRTNYVFSEEFRLVSPHELMHLELGGMNPHVPARFEEGTIRSFEKCYREADRAYREADLARYARLQDPELRTIDAAFRADRRVDDAEGNLAAAFALFLRNELGKERFWEFYERLARRNHAALLREFLELEPSEVNEAFEAFVTTLEPPPPELR